jgi:hypothetical protein
MESIKNATGFTMLRFTKPPNGDQGSDEVVAPLIRVPATRCSALIYDFYVGVRVQFRRTFTSHKSPKPYFVTFLDKWVFVWQQLRSSCELPISVPIYTHTKHAMFRSSPDAMGTTEAIILNFNGMTFYLEVAMRWGRRGGR